MNNLPEDIPNLIQELKNPDAEKRRKAVVALGKTNDPRVVPSLIAMLNDPRPPVVDCAVSALGNLRDRRAVEPIIKFANSQVSHRAIDALGKIGDARALPVLMKLINGQDVSSNARASAVWALAKLDANVDVILALLNCLDHSNRSVQEAAGEMLERIDLNLIRGDRKAAKLLIQILKRANMPIRVRRGVALALGDFDDTDAIQPLIEASAQNDPFLRANAIEALAKLNDIRAIIPLQTAMYDVFANTRRRAIIGLSNLARKFGSADLNIFYNALNDQDIWVRWFAAEFLFFHRIKDAPHPLAAALGTNLTYKDVSNFAFDAVTERDAIVHDRIVSVVEIIHATVKHPIIALMMLEALAQDTNQSIVADAQCLAHKIVPQMIKALETSITANPDHELNLAPFIERMRRLIS
jgi:HEAT repeat protein